MCSNSNRVWDVYVRAAELARQIARRSNPKCLAVGYSMIAI